MNEPERIHPDHPLPVALVEVRVTEASLGADVQFTCVLECPSGRSCVGDAEHERVIDVPPGLLRISVARDHPRFAQLVLLKIATDG